MENASKALIIAGAILISIILISIGIMVIQAGNGVVDQAGEQMDQQAIQAFNAQFANFAGSQRGSTVRSLLQTVIASNASSSNPSITVQKNGTAVTDVSALLSDVKPSGQYNIVFTSATNGRISTINITGTFNT